MNVEIFSSKLSIQMKAAGAEVISVKNSDNLEYMWQGDASIWSRHAPVLFPIVGKLKDDSYIYKGQKYALSQHGFARDMAFKLMQHTANTCTFELSSSSETKTNYPFDFIFQIQYSLQNNVLETKYTVRNSGAEIIYYSLGAHPGFRCPLLENESFEDYYLEFER